MKKEDKHILEQSVDLLITVQQRRKAQLYISWGLMTRNVKGSFQFIYACLGLFESKILIIIF